MKQKKAKALARQGEPIRQVAALPYRRSPEGELCFLLITSRKTRRFVIPKGWPMEGLRDWEAAAVEAEEEAGVIGVADPTPVGHYEYWKRLKSAFVPVTVTVFPLEVAAELPDWRERGQRMREWVTRSQAAALIDEPELMSLVENFTP